MKYSSNNTSVQSWTKQERDTIDHKGVASLITICKIYSRIRNCFDALHKIKLLLDVKVVFYLCLNSNYMYLYTKILWLVLLEYKPLDLQVRNECTLQWLEVIPKIFSFAGHWSKLGMKHSRNSANGQSRKRPLSNGPSYIQTLHFSPAISEQESGWNGSR